MDIQIIKDFFCNLGRYHFFIFLLEASFSEGDENKYEYCDLDISALSMGLTEETSADVSMDSGLGCLL